MAGTFADQALLASNNDFIAAVGRAMISRAVLLYYSTTAQPFSTLQQSKQILDTAAGNAANIAKLVVEADAMIKANSPAMPSDAAIQSATNTVLTALLK